MRLDAWRAFGGPPRRDYLPPAEDLDEMARVVDETERIVSEDAPRPAAADGTAATARVDNNTQGTGQRSTAMATQELTQQAILESFRAAYMKDGDDYDTATRKAAAATGISVSAATAAGTADRPRSEAEESFYRYFRQCGDDDGTALRKARAAVEGF